MNAPFKLLAAAAMASGLLHAATDGRTAEYVDSQVCAKCHAQIARDYARTGMGRSFFRPAPSNTLEAYAKENDAAMQFYHALSDTHFSMTVRGGQYFQRRWQT